MTALVASVLLASLVGSPHCAGMCGPFVAFYSGQGGARWPAHLAYNGGRLLSYLLLGAVAGALGAGVERMGAMAGVSRAAAILSGTAMILWGALAILRELGLRVPGLGEPTLARGPFAVALRAVAAQPPAVRALTVGLLTTLLPCGFLYVFVATAAGTGSPAHGMMVMAVFWLGTVPVMTGLGLLAQSALGPLRRRLPVLTALALVVLGVFMVAGRIVPTPDGSCPHCAETRSHAGH